MTSLNTYQYPTIIIMLFLHSLLSGQNQIEIDSVKGPARDAIRIIYAEDDGVHVQSAGGDGIYVANAGINGISVFNAISNGIHVSSAGGDGVFVGNVGDDGLNVQTAGDDGLQVTNAGDNGVFVNSAGNNGFYVANAEFDGVHVEIAGRDGFFVGNAGDDGVHVNSAVDNGVVVTSAGDVGVFIESAGDDGVLITNSGGDGVFVFEAGDDGVHVVNAVDKGIVVENAGGDGVHVVNADGHSMNIQGNKNIAGELSGHIAQIYNRNTGTGPDVLALKVGRTADLGGGVNFVTFYNGDNEGMGRIEGNGLVGNLNGVVYATTGADFAECLPLLSADEGIEDGDIVGVYEGKISLHTEDATTVMVITDRPAVLGNSREDSSTDEKVSFIGQVPVNVRGTVNEGDWIVASGREDGSAIAISSSDITLEHRIVGRSWESNEDEEIKKVMTVVGLDQSEAKDAIIGEMNIKLKEQQESIDDLQNQLDEVMRLISRD